MPRVTPQSDSKAARNSRQERALREERGYLGGPDDKDWDRNVRATRAMDRQTSRTDRGR